MSVKSFIHVAAVAAVAGLAFSTALASITIPTVPIGNPGNAADFTGFGSVAYSYNIGTTEVTAGQYTAFLNAVARNDPNGLYNGLQARTDFGSGIARSGSSGSYSYSVDPAFVNRPVNFVSFWDATRFANWLHNGQPTGPQNASTPEDGAYTLTFGGIFANTITRNAGWQWAVTSEDEWYKAAFFQPASAGGDADNYWLYPTSSNAAPTIAQANINFAIGNTSPVGSYAPNYYGTFDMGGNVLEWNEAIFGFNRGLRGGSFVNAANFLRADTRNNNTSMEESNAIGFRISQVPTPGSVALLAIGGLAAARRRR